MALLRDREAIYRALWNLTDRHGVIKLSQQETAKEIGFSYQRLSEIYLEFIHLGIMKKFAHRFQLKDPDKYNWEKINEAALNFRSERGR